MHHQTSSKLTWPGDDADVNFQNKIVRKWIFSEKKPAKGKPHLSHPVPHSSFQTGLDFVGSQREWLLLAA